jgi:soluble lytic murein transglycosylase-like protein
VHYQIYPKTVSHYSKAILLFLVYCIILGVVFSVANADVNAKRIVEAISDTSRANFCSKQELDNALNGIDPKDPIWPLQTFLIAEIHRQQNDDREASRVYTLLIDWAAKDPYKDGSMGSSLATVALWRWLTILSKGTEPVASEVSRAQFYYRKISTSRLVRGFYDTKIIGTLPQIEEDIIRQLALLHARVGKDKQARIYFLDYLRIAGSTEMEPMESKLFNQLIEAGLSSDRINLMRAKRLYDLRRFEEALYLLNRLTQSEDQSVRAEAGLYHAYILWAKREPRSKVFSLLGSVAEDATDPNIAQEAIFQRAIYANRRGKGRDVKLFITDMKHLLDLFPGGDRYDDGLYRLAVFSEYEGDIGKALDYYCQLREYDGPNDWTNLACFKPALIKIRLGSSQDLSAARQILKELVDERPFGPLYLNALFWLGRIAEAEKKPKEAINYFTRIVEESPFDYYALRARTHLNVGPDAKIKVWPDQKTLQDLQTAWKETSSIFAPVKKSPFHLRFEAAIEEGYYKMALSAYDRLRQTYPSMRVEELSITQLDQGMLSGLAVLFSLRQDVLAAIMVDPIPKNRQYIAAKLTNAAQDLAMSMFIVVARQTFPEERAADQRSLNYLYTCYPKAFQSEIEKFSNQYGADPAILYSISRRESLFYPLAISDKNALGLFQFTSWTFNSLDKRWNLLAKSQQTSREAYLLNPSLSLDLGAQYLQKSLIEQQYKGDILLALMDHNAGYWAVKYWRKWWEDIQRSKDIEYMIETIEYGETRSFTRRVLADSILIKASGFFKSGLENIGK